MEASNWEKRADRNKPSIQVVSLPTSPRRAGEARCPLKWVGVGSGRIREGWQAGTPKLGRGDLPLTCPAAHPIPWKQIRGDQQLWATPRRRPPGDARWEPAGLVRVGSKGG